MRRASSAERNTDGHRLQCLARALVRVALFVIALRKRLALVDGDAARDYPPLIGNGLRDPIADEALAGLVLSGHAIAASSGLGLIMLVAIPGGLAGLLPYERFRRRVLGSPHHGASLTPRYLENDFQLDRGAERKACDAIHQAARTPVFSDTSCSNSQAASATFG